MTEKIVVKSKNHEKAARELAAKINSLCSNVNDPYSPSARVYSISNEWYVELGDFGFEAGYNFVNDRGLYGGNVNRNNKSNFKEPLGPVFDKENSSITLTCWDNCLVQICDK